VSEPSCREMLAPVVERLIEVVGSSRCLVGASLGARTTYRVGGDAAVLCELVSHDELFAVAEIVADTNVPTMVVGRGSNLLVAERGYAGLVLTLSGEFANVTIGSDASVRAGSAAPLPVVARTTAAAGLRGFEWAVGVPGTIGGAVRMNAGGHGSDMGASLVSARVVDLASGPRLVERSRADLRLGYRTSAVGDTEVVVDVSLQLSDDDESDARSRIDEVVRWRREHQPGGQNAGSVFRNPPADSAGRLIDTAGAKGLRIGSAQVSEKHANFIVVDEGGSADDVYALMAAIIRRVHSGHGVWLTPETRTVGFAEALPGAGHP
jgi:UDP-N-acetylmuramate dehydrogenase